MLNSPEILRLRVLLCFLRAEEKDCTVMEIARTLRTEHYSVSRAMKALEKEGLISREKPRKLCLTEKGRILAEKYDERIHITTSHLLYEGVHMESAAKDAYYWALYNTEETMEVIRSAEEKYRVKYELRDQKQFGGDMLCKRLKDGEYSFPFIIYREHAREGSNISTSNERFEHPCVLSVRDGVGTLSLRALDTLVLSSDSGKMVRRQIENLKYLEYGSDINADRSGNVLFIPASALQFKNVGDGMGQILHGQVCMKIRCTEGTKSLPESKVIFTIFI